MKERTMKEGTMKEAKGVLIERCRALDLGKPQFETSSTGPAHQRVFSSEVTINGEVRGRAQAKTKREAERQASALALAFLEQDANAPAGPTESGAAFGGPWPLFPRVLAASLAVANSRVDAKLTGKEAVGQVQELALELYKGSLVSLGELVEVDGDDGADGADGDDANSD